MLITMVLFHEGKKSVGQLDCWSMQGSAKVIAEELQRLFCFGFVVFATGLLEVFTLQLSPIFNSSVYNWFLLIPFCVFFISELYPQAKDGHTWIFL